MLTVTESAAKHLSGLLSEGESDHVLRLTRAQDGLALVPDQPKTGDEVHEHDGKPVLVVDEGTATAIGPQTLDIQFQAGQARLTLR